MGTLSSWVYTGVSAANGGLGGLTFVYQVTETGSDLVSELGLNGFAGIGPQVDVGYNTAVSAVAPSDAYWTTGGTVNFNFVPNNVTSRYNPSDHLIVNTTATSFSESSASVQNQVTADTYDLAPVPEPTTMIAARCRCFRLGPALCGFCAARTTRCEPRMPENVKRHVRLQYKGCVSRILWP